MECIYLAIADFIIIESGSLITNVGGGILIEKEYAYSELDNK